MNLTEPVICICLSCSVNPWSLAFTFSSQWKHIFSGGIDRTIKIWDIESAEIINTLHGHNDMIKQIDVSPDGKYLASASDDKTIKLWDIDSGGELKTLKGHAMEVLSVDFSPNGEQLVSAGRDLTARLRDVSTGQQVMIIGKHHFTIDHALVKTRGREIRERV